MNRRTLLATAGVAFAGLLGGCTGSDDSGTGSTGTSGSSGTDASTGTAGAPATTQLEATNGMGTTATGSTATDGSTASTTASMPTEVTAGPPATDTAAGTTSTSVPIPDPQSTQEAGGAAVSFENGGSRIVVTGTIVAQDGCRRAALDSVEANGDSLVISVGTERDAGTNAMCTQALTPVDYRFVVTPDSVPDSVTVVHNGAGERRTVATVDRDG